MKEKLTEYEALKKKALEQFRKGKHLLGKDGAFQPLLKEFPFLTKSSDIGGDFALRS
jgi:hypothetical protein